MDDKSLKYVKPGAYDPRVNTPHTHPVAKLGQIFEDNLGNKYIYLQVSNTTGKVIDDIFYTFDAESSTHCHPTTDLDDRFELVSLFPGKAMRINACLCFKMIAPVFNQGSSGPIGGVIKTINDIQPTSGGEFGISAGDNITIDDDNNSVVISATIPESGAAEQISAASSQDPNNPVTVKAVKVSGVNTFQIATNLAVSKLGTNVLMLTAPQAGQGTVKSVNGVEPNSSGELVIGSPQINGVVYGTGYNANSMQYKFLNRVYLGEDSFPYGSHVDMKEGAVVLQSSGDTVSITKQTRTGEPDVINLEANINPQDSDREYNRSMCEIISEGTGYTGVKDLLTGHQAFDLPLKSKVPPEYPFPATTDVYMDLYYSSYIDQVMAVGPENERKQGPFYLWTESPTVTRYSFMAIAVSEYNSYPVLQCLTYFRSGSGTVTNWKTYRVGPEGSGLPQKVTINITKEMKDMAMYPLSVIEGQFYMPGSTWQGYTDWKFQPYLIIFGHIFYRYTYLH
jgi:hypothetical protein